ncbi:aspartic proteinase precursor [Trametes elegans]|nr:aspartic proteinase precursor [Trametes elegans]
MFAVARLLAFVALTVTTAVVANPVVVRDSPVRSDVVRRRNGSRTSAQELLAHDQARARAFNTAGKEGLRNVADVFAVNASVVNSAYAYTVNVGVGTPPTQYSLLVDTGSSNTWIGARGKNYTKTGSSVDTGKQVVLAYGAGSFSGQEYLDTVTIGKNKLTNLSIGVASNVSHFDRYDGILGIGPTGLTVHTTSGGQTVPTILDNAFSQGVIKNKVLGISFEPTTEINVTNGELTSGDINPSKFTDEIAYTSPWSKYVGVDQSITYGSSGKKILTYAAGFTDTGTTLIMLASDYEPQDAFSAYQNDTGAVQDDSVGLLMLTKEQFSKLESLLFHIGDHTYELTPNAQIWPRAVRCCVSTTTKTVYLIVADLVAVGNGGPAFVSSLAFLERFYIVWDAENAHVGFATTPFTYAATN